MEGTTMKSQKDDQGQGTHLLHTGNELKAVRKFAASSAPGVILSPEDTQTPFALSLFTATDTWSRFDDKLKDLDPRYELFYVLTGGVKLHVHSLLSPGLPQHPPKPSQHFLPLDHEQERLIRYFPIPSDWLSSQRYDSESLQWLKRCLDDVELYQLPNQTNRLALIFDPFAHGVPFTFGLEIFESGRGPPQHIHTEAHELFFVLSGHGTAFCNEEKWKISPGDTVVFPPTSRHGIDNHSQDRLYCLEMMFPNQVFAELVMSGRPVGAATPEDKAALGVVGEACV